MIDIISECLPFLEKAVIFHICLRREKTNILQGNLEHDSIQKAKVLFQLNCIKIISTATLFTALPISSSRGIATFLYVTWLRTSYKTSRLSVNNQLLHTSSESFMRHTTVRLKPRTVWKRKKKIKHACKHNYESRDSKTLSRPHQQVVSFCNKRSSPSLTLQAPPGAKSMKEHVNLRKPV